MPSTAIERTGAARAAESFAGLHALPTLTVFAHLALAFLALLALPLLPLHLFQQLLQLLRQLPLTFLQLAHHLFELLRRERLLVALLTLLRLAGTAALIELEGFVHQALLLAHHAGKLVHLPHHLLVHRRHLAGRRHLQIVEHLLQLA